MTPPPFHPAQVPADERLKVKVFDHDQFSRNEFLGRVTIDLHREVALQPGGDVTRSWPLQEVPAEWTRPNEPPRASTVTLRLQWVPFT